MTLGAQWPAEASASTTARPLAGQHRHVLVTGGTKGLGLATARAFARQGARCILTHAFGSADEAAVERLFAEDGSPAPIIERADASKTDDTRALLERLATEITGIDVLVSNAATALVVKSLDDYTERGLLQSVRGTVWPTLGYLIEIRKAFGKYPRYCVVMSSTGPDRFSVQYDFVAGSKAMLETLCRYLTYRLRDHDIRINMLRTRGVRTDSLDATFGAEIASFASRFIKDSEVMHAEDVADVALALCSGLLDGVAGQTITVDRGAVFRDNISHFFAEREALGL